MNRNSMTITRQRGLKLLLIPLSLLLMPAVAAGNDYSIVPEQFIYCTTCHGVELQGNRAVDAPRLNGMEDWYVRNQLLSFQRGWRGSHDDLIGMEMRPQATILDAAGVAAAVAFVGSVTNRADNKPDSVIGDPSRGQQLYATCAACHGGNAEGNKLLNAPRLTGQSDWYLLRQLQHFAQGIRGSADGDNNGAQMRASVIVLPDAQAMADVVAYISTLN